MSWNSDKEPIPYLEQRVKYYKKKRGTVRKLINDPFLLTKYGEEILGDMVENSLRRIDEQIENFTDAVNILKTVYEIEDKVENKQTFKS